MLVHPPTRTRRPTLAHTSARATPGGVITTSSKPVATASTVSAAAIQERQPIFNLLPATEVLPSRSQPVQRARTVGYRIHGSGIPFLRQHLRALPGVHYGHRT